MDRAVGIQAEFCVPGIARHGDIEDIVRLIAPRSLYISATTDDKYSRGAARIIDQAIAAFPPGKLVSKIWPGGHVFTREMRQAVYEVLEKSL